MARRAQMPRKTGQRQAKGAPAKGAAGSRMMLWVVIGAAVLIVAGLIALQGRSLSQTPVAQGVVGEGTAWGPADAPVKIVNYSNFGCGHCRNFALNQGRQLRQEYEPTGQVRFEFKQFELGDASTSDAAAASECAADQGRFWDYHDILFTQQGTSANPFTRSALKQYGAQLNLDTASFNRCIDSGEHADEVHQDSQEGLAQGVEGTPTFFINGEMLVGDVPYETFKDTVDAALAAAS